MRDKSAGSKISFLVLIQRRNY